MVVMRSREKGKQEQSRSALQAEHGMAFGFESIASRLRLRSVDRKK
jgi:hypothetical protein